MPRASNVPVINNREYQLSPHMTGESTSCSNGRDINRGSNVNMMRHRFIDDPLYCVVDGPGARDLTPPGPPSAVLAKNYISYPPSYPPSCCHIEVPFPFYEEECPSPIEVHQQEGLQYRPRPPEISHPDSGNIQRLHINERVVQMCQQRQHRSITPAEYHKTSPLFGKFLPRPAMRVPNISYCGMDPFHEVLFDPQGGPEVPLIARGVGGMSTPIPFVSRVSPSQHDLGLLPMETYYPQEPDRKMWYSMSGGFDGYARDVHRPTPYRLPQEPLWQDRSLQVRADAGSSLIYDLDKEKNIDRNSIFVYPSDGAGNRPYLKNKGYYIKFLFNKCVVVDLMTSANKLAAFFKNVDIGFAIGDPYKNLGDRWCLMTCSDKFNLMVGTMVMIHYCRRKFLKKRGTVDKKIKNEQREKDRKLQHSYTRTTFKFLCDGVMDKTVDSLRDELIELTRQVNDCAQSQANPAKEDNQRSIFGEYNVISASIDDFEGMHHAISTYLYSLEKQPGNIDTLIANQGEIDDPCLRCFIGEKDPVEPEYIVGVVSAVKTKPDTAMSVMYKILERIIDANEKYGAPVEGSMKVFLRFYNGQALYQSEDKATKEELRRPEGVLEFSSNPAGDPLGQSSSESRQSSPLMGEGRVTAMGYSADERTAPVCPPPLQAMVDIAS